MGSKNYQLLKCYQAKSFSEMNKALYNQFFFYVLILLGFTIMAISFIQGLDFLSITKINQISICLLFLPIIYIIIKSIYGLILLQNSYQAFHYHLVSEYSLLFIIGYQIILLSLSFSFVYCYESLLLILIGLLFKAFKNIIIIFVSIIIPLLCYQIFLPTVPLNILLVVFTYLFTMVMLSPILFRNNKKVNEQIKIMHSELEHHPEKRIKDFLSF